MNDLNSINTWFVNLKIVVRPLRINLRVEAFRGCFTVVMEVAVMNLVEVFAEIIESNIENPVVSTNSWSF